MAWETVQRHDPRIGQQGQWEAGAWVGLGLIKVGSGGSHPCGVVTQERFWAWRVAKRQVGASWLLWG